LAHATMKPVDAVGRSARTLRQCLDASKQSERCFGELLSASPLATQRSPDRPRHDALLAALRRQEGDARTAAHGLASWLRSQRLKANAEPLQILHDKGAVHQLFLDAGMRAHAASGPDHNAVLGNRLGNDLGAVQGLA